jgi:hypothetical protein
MAETGVTDFKSQKKLVETLKSEWKLMWSERFDDKPRAEGVSMDSYQNLGVERGTIIHATRDFKALNFTDILLQHKVEQPHRFIQPDQGVGGWGKFIKKEITNSAQNSKHTAVESNCIKKKSNKPQSKSSGGWLHVT